MDHTHFCIPNMILNRQYKSVMKYGIGISFCIGYKICLCFKSSE